MTIEQFEGNEYIAYKVLEVAYSLVQQREVLLEAIGVVENSNIPEVDELTVIAVMLLGIGGVDYEEWRVEDVFYNELSIEDLILHARKLREKLPQGA